MKYVVDADNQILGRIASEVAHVLQDKHEATYSPHISGKTRVLIKNASKIQVSGKKAEQKIYYKHTGYQGNLKETPYAKMFAKSPEKVIRLAVSRMLPKNKLLKERMKRLTIEA